jgi:hypothetical protein
MTICTDPDNCKRCRGHASAEHAGIFRSTWTPNPPAPDDDPKGMTVEEAKALYYGGRAGGTMQAAMMQAAIDFIAASPFVKEQIEIIRPEPAPVMEVDPPPCQLVKYMPSGKVSRRAMKRAAARSRRKK